MINKDLVKKRFSKSLEKYNENAKIQKRMAENLVKLINKTSVDKILEIGCGTGFLTQQISDNFEFKDFTTIDIINDCEKFIKKINKNISFKNIDVEAFLKDNTTEKYDLIVSNAVLQWIDNFEATILALQKRLNTGGELIFTTFGKENFKEIYQVTETTLKYYSINELKEMFKPDEITQEIHIIAFEKAIDVLKHIQLTGVNGIINKTWTKKDLIKFENSYKNICTLRPTLTYNPIYIKITK